MRVRERVSFFAPPKLLLNVCIERRLRVVLNCAKVKLLVVFTKSDATYANNPYAKYFVYFFGTTRNKGKVSVRGNINEKHLLKQERNKCLEGFREATSLVNCPWPKSTIFSPSHFLVNEKNDPE